MVLIRFLTQSHRQAAEVAELTDYQMVWLAVLVVVVHKQLQQMGLVVLAHLGKATLVVLAHGLLLT
jgi:hypothetical protein